MASCDIQALLDANPCYGSLEPMDLALLEYGLLCAIKEKLVDGTVPSCDVQTLLEDTTCARVLYPSPLDAISAQLAMDIAGYTGIPAISGCMASLSPWFLQLVITQLYCIIADVLDGGEAPTSCDIAALIAAANCFNSVEPVILSRLRVSLLCTIATEIVDPPTPPACALSITTNPSNFTGEVGESFSMTVAWSGAIGTGTVQWQRDDGGGGWIDIVDGEFDGTVASGATTPTLTVTNVALATAGSYRAVVTDNGIASCTATSTTATVTVNPATGNGLLTDLIAFWRFEEASGNALDSSGNNHTLVQQGTIASDAGIVELARSYNKDEHFYFSNTSSAFNRTSSPFSVTGWIKPQLSAFDTNDFTFAAKGSYLDGTLAWWLLLDHGTPDDALTCYYTTDGVTLQSLSVTITGGINTNLFHFVALRWDGATLRLSITAEDEGSVSASTSTTFAGPFYSTTDPLVVGDMPGSTIHAMDGIIDEMSYYGSSLSDCQLTALFQAKDGVFSYPLFNGGVCV